MHCIEQETHHLHPPNPFTQNTMFISQVIEDKCKTNTQLRVSEYVEVFVVNNGFYAALVVLKNWNKITDS